MNASNTTPAPAASPQGLPGLTKLALFVSGVVLLGSLGLSIGLGLKPCPFCYYQRTFVMAVFAVLLVGWLARVSRTALLALPAAAAGLFLAAWHVYLERAGKMECPAGLWGLGTAPMQSLAGFLVLFALLLAAVLADRTRGARTWAGLAVGLALGLFLTVAAVKSVVPVKLPPEELQGDPKICRPPQPPPA